jgi:hypothetical protein
MADEPELDESGNPIVFFDISLGGELPFLGLPRFCLPCLVSDLPHRPVPNCLCMMLSSV